MNRHPESIAAVLSAIPSLPRPVLARLVACIIERMDEMDDDADLEPNGDDADTNGDEGDYSDDGDHGYCFHFGINQSEPLATHLDASVPIALLV